MVATRQAVQHLEPSWDVAAVTTREKNLAWARGSRSGCIEFARVQSAKNVKKRAIFDHFRAKSRSFPLSFGPFLRQQPLGCIHAWRRAPSESAKKIASFQGRRRAASPHFSLEHNKNNFRADKLPAHRHFHFHFLPDRQSRSRKTRNSIPDIAETFHEACPRLRARL